eukprot:COSAG02_NODE_23763_length_709_cov_0.832787_1_plen_171_part_00
MQSKLFGHRSVSRKGYFSRVNRRGASRQHMVRPGEKARTRWTKTTAQTTAPASVYPHVIFGPVKPSAALLVLRLFCCSRLYVAAGRTHRPRTRARRVCCVVVLRGLDGQAEPALSRSRALGGARTAVQYITLRLFGGLIRFLIPTQNSQNSLSIVPSRRAFFGLFLLISH